MIPQDATVPLRDTEGARFLSDLKALVEEPGDIFE